MKTTLLKCPRCQTEVAASRAEGMRGICPRCLFEALVNVADEADAKSPLQLLEGLEIGNYIVLGLLGSGGMGVVYRARQKGLERTVALKLLNPPGQARREDVERFFREARAAARLQHPHIVSIHEVANDKGYYFFTMDLVEGHTLANDTRDGGMPVERVAAIAIKVARAVHYAHENGIVHRDLKPGNILVDRAGEPKVMDFGLAKDISSDVGLTSTGVAMGTPSYMPPEQAAGKNIDARTDVYALGAVIYESLTGRPPFLGSSAVEVVRRVMEDDPMPPRAIRPDVPRDLETICLKALQKDPDRRYPTALALAEDLERFARGEPILGQRPSIVYRVRRAIARHPAAALLLFVLPTLALGSIVALRPWKHEKRDAVVDSGPPRYQKSPSYDKHERAAEAEKHLSEARRLIGMAEKVRAKDDRIRRNEWLSASLTETGEVLKADAQDAEAHYLRGMAHLHLYQLNEALDDLTRALRFRSDHIDARYWRAIIRMDLLLEPQAVRMEAAELYVLEMWREDAQILELCKAPADRSEVVSLLPRIIGLMHLAVGHQVKAVPEERWKSEVDGLRAGIERVKKADPTNAYAYLVEAFILTLDTDRTPASLAHILEVLDRAADYAPNDLTIQHWLITQLAIAGRCDEALQHSQDLEIMAPDVDQTHLFAAMAYHAAGKTDLRDAALDRARKISPKAAFVEFVPALLELGLLSDADQATALKKAMADPEKAKRALAGLDKVLALEPEVPLALCLRGTLRASLSGKPQDGIVDIQRFVALSPPSERVSPLDKLIEPPSTKEDFAAYFDGIQAVKRMGLPDSELSAKCSLGLIWYAQDDEQRALLYELARMRARRGNRMALLGTLYLLFKKEWYGWPRLEREFPALLDDPAYLEIKKRSYLSDALDKARLLVDKGRQRVENANKLTSASDRGLRQEWLRQAIADLDRASEIYPNIVEAPFWLGRAYEESQQWAAAIDAYTEALRVDPIHHESHYRRALANFALAMRRLTTGMALPESGHLKMMREDGKHLRDWEVPRDWRETATAIGMILEAMPEEEKLSKPEFAGRLRRHGEDALKANPGNAWGQILLFYAIILDPPKEDEAKVLEAAIAILRRALELEPNNLFFHCGLAQMLMSAKKKEEALTEAEQAILIAPRSEEAYLLRASLLGRLGREADAWKDLDRALECSADPAALRVRRAEERLNQAHKLFPLREIDIFDDGCRQALVELDAALALRPDDPAALLMRGQIYLLKNGDPQTSGHPERGEADLRRLVERHPDHKYRKIADSWLKIGNRH